MTEVDDALARLGGKALSLERLTDAGFPVPAFVTVPTDEYLAFIDEANLHAPLFDALTEQAPAAAAETIRLAFAGATMRRKQRDRIVELVAPLADAPVAVRSSATAEDSPDLSFAGQLESFLDVRGTNAIVDAVVACWASAWTERAIAYRDHHGVPHAGVAVAVIVQRLVPAEASGVLFTANPLTGRRDETVIDATTGLGDRLVGGHAIPDSYVVDTATGLITGRTLAGADPVLTPAHAAALTDLGRRAAALFGGPQDVEWVRVGDDLQIVQSRPVTTLFPLPSDDPAHLWVSFGAFQGVLGPLTPLGLDLIRHLLAGAARSFGRVVDPADAPYIGVAAERLWIRLDDALRNAIGRRALDVLLPMADPGVARIVGALADEPAFAVSRRTPSLTTGVGLASFLGRMAPRLPSAMRHPSSSREHLDDTVARYLAGVDRSLAAASRIGDPALRLEAIVLAAQKFARTALPTLLPVFGPIMGPGGYAIKRLRELAAKTGLPDADALALHALRALPGNVTTAMDIALWDASRALRTDPHAWGVVADTPPAELARLYLARHLPTVALEAVDGFLATYGVRGVAEIDLGAPRWRDDPTAVMAMLASYVATDADVQSPRERHREGQREAGRAVRRLLDASRPRDAAEMRSLVHRIRSTMGARETPKFALIKAFGAIRAALDAEAGALVAAGVLASRDDLVFLSLGELRHAYAPGGDQGTSVPEPLAARVAERRAVRERELRRRAIPRVIVGDGRTFFDGVAAGPDGLSGSGVSPGVAEGRVRVVLDPRTQQVAPGEILVCPGTDPAWTPLFAHAAGLVTEVGGLMTHGSVVAREHGIPAVVGVRDVTTRLATGQHVRIDGTSGSVELLDHVPGT